MWRDYGRICLMAAGYYSEALMGRNGLELLSTWVPADLAAKFKTWARSNMGGASAELRELVTNAIEGRTASAPAGRAAGYSVMVRLREAERLALLEASQQRGMTPATWLRSLAIVHLGHRPQWNGAEIEALRELYTEVRRIGNNVNQIARALNVAAHKGEYSPYQGQEAREAAELVRVETRRIVAVMTGNFDYWGLPDADRPTAAPGAQERDDAATMKERRKIARRPRRRPARFVDK